MKGFIYGAITGTLLTVAATHSQQTQREPQFENATVKVWKTTVAPNQPTDLHRHDHPRVVIALTGGTMQLLNQNGTKEDHIWQAGKAYWLPAMPPGAMHRDVNPGTTPFEVVTVELEKEK
jgi:quercetin dioxygenase-like cupin family protein